MDPNLLSKWNDTVMRVFSIYEENVNPAILPGEHRYYKTSLLWKNVKIKISNTSI
jgi:hypothetical protein